MANKSTLLAWFKSLAPSLGGNVSPSTIGLYSAYWNEMMDSYPSLSDEDKVKAPDAIYWAGGLSPKPRNENQFVVTNPSDNDLVGYIRSIEVSLTLVGNEAEAPKVRPEWSGRRVTNPLTPAVSLVLFGKRFVFPCDKTFHAIVGNSRLIDPNMRAGWIEYGMDFHPSAYLGQLHVDGVPKGAVALINNGIRYPITAHGMETYKLDGEIVGLSPEKQADLTDGPSIN